MASFVTVVQEPSKRRHRGQSYCLHL